jgi:hypothetical protein
MTIQTIDRGTAGDTGDKFRIGAAFDVCQANDDYLNTLVSFTSQTGITAAGTSQGNATLLSTSDNFTLFEVTTVALNTGVRLPPSNQAMRVIIANRGVNPLFVYPYTGSGGGQMDGGNSITIQPMQTVLLAAKNSNQFWYSTLPINSTPSSFVVNGILTVADNNPTVYINTATGGQTTAVGMATNGNYRWKIYKNNEAEAGANAGSNFVISNYSDAGTYIGDALKINRATGVCSFNGVAHDVQSVNGVGSIRLMKNISGGTISGGASVAGSSLYPSYATSAGVITAIASSPAGTWKCIVETGISNNDFAEFLRVS